VRKASLLIAAAFVVAGAAMADDKPLDVTITVVESPADLPDAVTKTIALPPAASDRAHERAQPGLDTANQARTLGREFGQSIAEQAKTKGKGQSNRP
jgi:hypothetical protein